MTPSLTITDATGATRTIPINGPVSVGRNPECTVVVDDPEVSWRHCVLWVEHGVVWIRDLDSRNGTTVGGETVTRATPLADGAKVKAGSFESVLHCADTLGNAGHAGYALLDQSTGLRYGIRGDRFRIGPDPTDDLQLEGIESHTILVHEGGEIWLGDEELVLDQDYQIGPLTFRVMPAMGESQYASTLDATDVLYAYEVTVDLNGHTGPEARVVDVRQRLEHTVDATNRAILLYVLAKQWSDDQAEETPRAVRGWCSDDDVIIGVWGKAALADGAGKLKALLHRVRVELKGAGFDPWFIEKKRGYTRIRVASVKV